jgi:fermentation-respiration switch protein FrsA (DUF1100 family)
MQARTLVIHSDDLDLEAEYIIPEKPRAALVLCHGIPAGGPPDPSDSGYAGFARALAARGFAALWFNFRGCRGAAGEFSIGGWCTDIEGALEAIATVEETARAPRVLVGSSAGGMAAITVASRRSDVELIATLAAPASMNFAGLDGDVSGVLQRFRNIGIIHDPAYPPDPEAWSAELRTLAAEETISGISPRPLLLIHGDADDIVPYHHAERLFERGRPPKELVRIPMGHHQLRRDPRAVDALTDWLDHHTVRSGIGHTGQISPGK